MDKVINVASAIVTVALVSVIVTSANTSSIITSVGDAFSSSLKAAKGTK